MKKTLVFMMCCVLAAFATNITLQADFEGSADAVSKGRKITPNFTADSIGMFDEGIAGKAIKIGPWKDMPTPGTTDTADRRFGYEYGIRDSVNSKSGAVSFMIRPARSPGLTASTRAPSSSPMPPPM